MKAPTDDTWVALTADPLPAGTVHDWAIRPDCGAVVLFTGTVRDHAEGRPGVTLLEYEAYVEQAVPKLRSIADAAREQWSELGRIALLHRVGPLELCELAVVVAVSAPHRGEAFDAARWCIDTLKASVPIWKKERWRDGEDWGLAATALDEVPGPSGRLSGGPGPSGRLSGEPGPSGRLSGEPGPSGRLSGGHAR